MTSITCDGVPLLRLGKATYLNDKSGQKIHTRMPVRTREGHFPYWFSLDLSPFEAPRRIPLYHFGISRYITWLGLSVSLKATDKAVSVQTYIWKDRTTFDIYILTDTGPSINQSHLMTCFQDTGRRNYFWNFSVCWKPIHMYRQSSGDRGEV